MPAIRQPPSQCVPSHQDVPAFRALLELLKPAIVIPLARTIKREIEAYAEEIVGVRDQLGKVGIARYLPHARLNCWTLPNTKQGVPGGIITHAIDSA